MEKYSLEKQLIKMKLFLKIKDLLDKNKIEYTYNMATLITNDGMQIRLQLIDNGTPKEKTAVEVCYELLPTPEKSSNWITKDILTIKDFKKIFLNRTGIELQDNHEKKQDSSENMTAEEILDMIERNGR